MEYTTTNYIVRSNEFFAGPLGMVVILAIYLYVAYATYTIAKKTNTENAWFAWIPILNLIVLLKIARKSLWWIIGMLIPFVNIVVTIWVWMKIAEERRRPSWWGILMIIPIVNYVILYLLAFKEAANAVAPVPATPPAASPPTPPSAPTA